MIARRLASAYPRGILAAKRPISYSAFPRDVLRRPRRPFGSNAIQYSGIRHVSFARVIPQLAMKLIRLPAMFGVAMVGGAAYLQYQAAQAGTYAMDMFGKAKDAASTAANGLLEGAGDVFAQMGKGYDRTTNDLKGVQMPQWMKDIYEGRTGEEGEGGSGGPNEPKKSGVGVAGAATAGAFALNAEGEEDTRTEEVAARDDQMMLLTRKMIEIRSLLQTVGQSGDLTLPSIVVIGSQSSGKSSVLEAIVGHEFLPKGSNMVTRRPIELTLVNTPGAHAEYGEFPSLGLGKITDFSKIQRTLTDLNLAVPEEQCISDDPIQLRIYSPNIPDLSLTDLPGYIQIEASDQPTQLKMKIRELCEKYIRAPNVILAISAATDDLANSTALQASRRVDPSGERTIGVITKMDLVDPARGAQMLSDRNYPLRLGYVGVVCKIPQESRSLFSKGSANIADLITKNESAFFNTHSDMYGKDAKNPTTVGTPALRKKLMQILETTMSSSLAKTSKAIERELSEIVYNFKVKYQERHLTAETHLAASLDSLKYELKKFSDSFGRPEVREIVKRELDQQVLNLLAQKYWNGPVQDLHPIEASAGSIEQPLKNLPKAEADHPLWNLKLDACVTALKNQGIGQIASGATAEALQSAVEDMIQKTSFARHPSSSKEIARASELVLHDLTGTVGQELEICFRPYRHRVDLTDAEWSRSRDDTASVLKEELKACEAAMKAKEDAVGRRKARDVVSFIEKVRKGDVIIGGSVQAGAGGFSAELLEQGREALFLRDRADIIRMRLAAVQSRQCKSQRNKMYCPEIFLNAVADKLTSTADIYLDAELLEKFFSQIPRVLEGWGKSLDSSAIDRFAREDKQVQEHLDLVRKKESLEMALKEIENLRHIEARERSFRNNEGSERSSRRRWGLF